MTWQVLIRCDYCPTSLFATSGSIPHEKVQLESDLGRMTAAIARKQALDSGWDLNPFATRCQECSRNESRRRQIEEAERDLANMGHRVTQ